MAKNQQLPLNPDEISGVCGRLLCCLSYEDDLYREQNKKMPKLGAEVVTSQGTGRVRHIHPLKESVTVMLENHAFVEIPVSELVSSKTASGHGCSTCGGCTVKRRAGAEEDNARARTEMAKRKSAKQGPQKPVPGAVAEGDIGQEGEADAVPESAASEAQRRRRRRNRPERPARSP
jgi:hypothetical protein